MAKQFLFTTVILIVNDLWIGMLSNHVESIGCADADRNFHRLIVVLDFFLVKHVTMSCTYYLSYSSCYFWHAQASAEMIGD